MGKIAYQPFFKPHTFSVSSPWQEGEGFSWPKACVLSPAFQSLLLEMGSLTRCLESYWQAPVRVNLLRQEAISDIRQSDYPDFMIAIWQDDQRSWQQDLLLREAWLMVADEAKVFAHSQLALSGLPKTIRQQILQGEKPLGPLFLDEGFSVARDCLQIAPIKSPELSLHLGLGEEQVFWGRRSLFRVDGVVRARIFELFLGEF
ncbi:chorismate--pyruvate lyase family protein [Magnetococcales bacterium HHB-1]